MEALLIDVFSIVLFGLNVLHTYWKVERTVSSPFTASRATLALIATLCCFRMFRIMSILLFGYDRLTSTLLHCPVFGEYYTFTYMNIFA